jgi:hypothetical protein
MRSIWRKQGGKGTWKSLRCKSSSLSFHIAIIKPQAAIAVLSFFLFSFIFSPAFPQTSIEKALSERRQALLEYLVEKESTPSFAAVVARYATNERVAEANQMLSQLMQQPSGEPGYAFNLIATYLFGQRSMPDSLHEKVRQIFSTHAFMRGDGEANYLLYYVSLLLAAQSWPDMTAEQWFNGKSSAQNWREAHTYLTKWMETMVTQGQVQFDSPELLPSFVAALELLHEFMMDDHPLAAVNGNAGHAAEDTASLSNLRTRVSMMLDLLLIDFALEQIDGMYAGGHSYDSEPGVYSPRQSASSVLSWLYFGTGEMKSTPTFLFEKNQALGDALFSALSGYTVPETIYELATNRDPLGGYVHRERKRGRALVRNSEERNPVGYKYAYITRDYILGSVQGGLLYPLQQHTWDLTYLAPKDRHPVLYVMHPYNDHRELGSFFADEPPLLLEELTKFKSWYAQPDKLVGGSPYEQIFQHRNVLIALYNIPEEVKFGHLNGFFSEDLENWEATLSDGMPHQPDWIFCRAGNTYIAMRPLQPFRFEKMNGGWRYISEGRRNGIILEVSTPEETKTFEEFKRRVREVGKLEMRQQNTQLKVKYTTVYGDRMEFVYDSSRGTVERFLDDFPVRFTEWPLFENPFVKFDETKRLLTLRVGKKWRGLDFLNTLLSN